MKFSQKIGVIVTLLALTASGYAATDKHKTSGSHRTSKHQRVRSAKNAKTVRVNINKANAKQIAGLKGIGAKKAEAVVAYRKENGRFKSVSDLTKVRGISPRILKLNGKNIALTGK